MEAPVMDPAVSQSRQVYLRLKQQVIDSGLCTHCGTCAGLSGGALEMVWSEHGPLPQPATGASTGDLTELAYQACPGKGIDYPGLNQTLFGQMPESWLTGSVRQSYIGYSSDPHIRRQGASGGVITQVLLDLLEGGEIDGAVLVRQGQPEPWMAEPIIARTPEEIADCSQSVYVPIPVNQVIGEMTEFKGRLAYVGLPDQVAALRNLQRAGHPGALKVVIVLGPYVGTAFYLGAIQSYLRSNGIKNLDEILELRYREGEWPGYLQIRTRSGPILKASKFYYNYLTPFFITRSTLLSVDFTNELTDISVGDAWHPRYEGRGAGFSVVLARTEKGHAILKSMQERGRLSLEQTSLEDAMTMHGHMLDFKKRGTFIRLAWRKAVGLAVPEYGYCPETIPFSRYLVEAVVLVIFLVCGTRPARWLIERMPITVIGPVFDFLRLRWKALSKPTKRRGLGKTGYRLVQAQGERHEES